jgi:preprotein translocase subunit YajC
MFQLVIFGLIFLGMWFLLIAPNRRKQKLQQQMLGRLRVGDRVLLSSGIFAKIVQIKGAHLLVEMAKGVRMEILRGYVQQLAEPAVEEEEAPDGGEEASGNVAPAPRRGGRRPAKKS